MCPICGTALNLSGAPQADRERAFISQPDRGGASTKEQIKDALVAEYGTEVLAEPRKSGFSSPPGWSPSQRSCSPPRRSRSASGAGAARRGTATSGRDPAAVRPSSPARPSASTPTWPATTSEHLRRGRDGRLHLRLAGGRLTRSRGRRIDRGRVTEARVDGARRVQRRERSVRGRPGWRGASGGGRSWRTRARAAGEDQHRRHRGRHSGEQDNQIRPAAAGELVGFTEGQRDGDQEPGHDSAPTACGARAPSAIAPAATTTAATGTSACSAFTITSGRNHRGDIHTHQDAPNHHHVGTNTPGCAQLRALDEAAALVRK